MSLEELVGLVVELPSDSRVSIATFGEKARWDEQTYMIADIANGVRVLAHLMGVQLWSKQKNPGQQPEPPDLIHEPGWVKPPEKIGGAREAAQLLGGW